MASYKLWLDQSRSNDTAKGFLRYALLFCEFTKKNPMDATALDCARFFEHERRRGLCDTSIQHVAKALKRFFRVIGRADLVESMPQPRKSTTYVAPWFTFGEFKRLIRACRTPFELALITAGYELALRQNELCMLNKAELDTKKGLILVRREKRAQQTPDLLPIRKEAFYGRPLDNLLNYLKTRRDRDPAMFVVSGGNLGNSVRRISKRTYSYHLEMLLSRAGLGGKGFSPHSLRHTRLTHMALEQMQKYGVTDIAVIAKFAGHVSTSTTLIYSHLAGEALDGRNKKLQSVARPPYC